MRGAGPVLQRRALGQQRVHVTLGAQEVPVEALAVTRVAAHGVAQLPGRHGSDVRASRDGQVREGY